MSIKKTVPAVSVIIPIYNVEAYLRECLDSAVRQTLKKIEIICVDDGSPDNSVAIVEEYMKKYDTVKLVRKENGGLSSARNAGLDAATGEYVYFLDSDDYIEADMLKTLYKKASANNLDIIYFNTELFFESQKVRNLNRNYINYYTRQHDYSGVRTGQSMFAAMRKNREFLPSVCLQIFRRSLIEEYGLRFYNGILHEDNLFSFQCMAVAQRVDYDKRSYYHRRMHGNSIMTASKSIRNVEGYLVAYAEVLAFMHNRPVEEEAFDQLSEFLYTSLWGNGRRIFKDLQIPEEEAVFKHGDFCAQHFLDVVKRCGETEFERSRLKDENARLKKQNQELQNEVKACKEYRGKRYQSLAAKKYKGFVQCVQDHGLLYTIRRGFGKVWNALKNKFGAKRSGGKQSKSFVARKLRGFVQCTKDHGLAYTIRRGFGKVWNVLKKYLRKFHEKHAGNKVYRFLTWPLRKARSVARTIRKHGWTYHFRVWNAKFRQKKTMGAPCVSVIMPVYNVEAFIEQGMDSLINQTMRSIEIIAVDDGSTDRSLEILNSYAAKDSRVRVFTQQNKFAGAARNLGLEHARGEYVIFLDSDDFFAKNLCEDAYFAGKVNHADVVLFGARHYNNATGEFKEAKWLLNNYLTPEKQPFSYRDCPDVLYRISTPAPWTKMFRREFVQKAGLQFQCIQNANDLFFTYSALAMAERIVTVDKPLVNYRVGLVTNLQTTKKKHPFCFYEAYWAWHDKLAELGTLDILRQSYENVALSGCLHNLRTNQDPEVKKLVFEKLKNEVLEVLEIGGHEEKYYYSKDNYKDLLLIQNATFEEYMQSLEK